MNRLPVALIALVLVATGGCSTQAPREGTAEPAPSHEPTVASTPDASESGAAVARTAEDLLECDGRVGDIGGSAGDFGPEGSGDTPDGAFQQWLATTFFQVPRSGWEAFDRSGDRYAYVYRSDGRIKLVAVISPKFTELTGGAFTIDELRSCDTAEYGAAADLGPRTRSWLHEESGRIIVDIEGPSHCEWQSARMLHIETDGQPVKQYVRDPEGVLPQVRLLETFDTGLDMPADASFSGYRTADGLELWFVPGDRAAYVVTPDGAERWPRAAEPIGCA